MRKVFNQSYTTNHEEISCYYGEPPKKYYEGDVIRLHIGKGDDIFVTPDEASTIIRALSAGLSHYLVKNDKLALNKHL